MSPLRQQMIRVLELHRMSPDTIKPYVSTIAQLAQYYHRAPDRISIDEIRDFLHHLITVRKLSLATTAKYLHVTSKHVEGIRSPLDLLRLPEQERL